jgi:hypothetical protein
LPADCCSSSRRIDNGWINTDDDSAIRSATIASLVVGGAYGASALYGLVVTTQCRQGATF